MKYSLFIFSIVSIMVALIGCEQNPRRFPPSLTIENKSCGVVWFSYIKMDDRIIPFGGIGRTYSKTIGFSFDNIGDVRGAFLGLRISTAGEAGSTPWIERVYEMVDPVIPEKAVLEKVEEVRFVYFADGSAKTLFLGEKDSILGEIRMRLKEELSSEGKK